MCTGIFEACPMIFKGATYDHELQLNGSTNVSLTYRKLRVATTNFHVWLGNDLDVLPNVYSHKFSEEVKQIK